ncbi:MAG TPA: AI-2E family transporter [Aestuariivirgaceae bacterium]|nr:AI-2E family transporter [Aestuariivirgaceae bacterium]
MDAQERFVHSFGNRSTDRVLAIVLASALILAGLWIARPLYGVLVWGAFMAVALTPLHCNLTALAGGRPKIAAAAIVLTLLAIIVVPLCFLPASFENARNQLSTTNSWTELRVPPMPEWIGNIPFFGAKIAGEWTAAIADSKPFLASVKPYFGAMLRWLATMGASIGIVILQLLLSVVLAGIFMVTEATTTTLLHRIAARIGGTSAENLLDVAVRTVRSVVQGVIGTALIQGLLTGIGFMIIGVPFAAALGIFSFGTAMLQIGTWLVWVPVALWLSYQGETDAALFTAVLGVIINILDNVIKPLLIGRGAGVPLWVIFIGVIGGVLSTGLIGIFLGPLIMALIYSVVLNWLSQQQL